MRQSETILSIPEIRHRYPLPLQPVDTIHKDRWYLRVVGRRIAIAKKIRNRLEAKLETINGFIEKEESRKGSANGD